MLTRPQDDRGTDFNTRLAALLCVALCLSCAVMRQANAAAVPSVAGVANSFAAGSNGYQAQVPRVSQNFLAGVTPVNTGTAVFPRVDTATSTTFSTLTDGSFGTVPAAGSGNATEVAIPSNATLTYTLPAAVNISTIDVFGSWGDGGRSGSTFTVNYATAAAPTTFIAISSASSANPVNFNVSSNGVPSCTWVHLSGFTVNAVAIQFVFGAQHNGYCGYTELAAGGSETDDAANAAVGSAGYQPQVPSNTQNLLFGTAPVATGTAITAQGGGSANTTLLTDGQYGTVAAAGGGDANSVTIPNNATLTYTLPNAAGYTVNTVDIFTAWGDNGRIHHHYTVNYATVAAPTTFINLASVAYEPAGTLNGEWVHLSNLGLSGVNVKALQFVFPVQQNNYVGYPELSVGGSSVGASDIWSGGTSTDWGTGLNWQSTAVPSGANTVVFGTTGSNPIIDLGTANRTAASIAFLGGVNATLGSTNGKSLTLDNTALSAPVAIGGAGTNIINNAIILNSNLTITNSTGAQTSINGAISEGIAGQSLTAVAATTTITLGSANSYTGGTTLSSGTLNVADGALGTIGNVTFAGGTLQYKAATAFTVDISGRIKNSASSVAIDVNGDAVTYPGVIDATNTTGLTLTSTAANGSLTLSAANAYLGTTTITSGTLRINNANAIPHSATANTNPVTIAATGILDLNTNSASLNSLAGAGTVDTVAGGTPTLTLGSNNDGGTFSGVIKNSSGALALTKAGSGTVSLTGNNTYSGATTISGGILALSGTNTFSGTTTISAGKLRLLSPGSISAGGAVAINANAVLDGTGAANGLTTVNAKGHIAPGVNTSGNAGAVGSLTLGSASLLSGSILDLDLGNPGTSDLVAVTGALTLPSSGSVTVNLYNAGTMGNGTYKIITYGSLVNAFNASSLSIASTPLIGGTYTFVQTGTEIDLVITGTTGLSAGVFSVVAYNSTSGTVPLIAAQMSDTNIGLTTNKNYLTAVNITGNTNAPLTINSVPFGSGQGVDPITVSAQNFSLAGCANLFPGPRANNTVGQINTLLTTFNYGVNANPQIATFSGLTPGQTYVATYYNQTFASGAGGTRFVTVTGSDGGKIAHWSEDCGNTGDGNLLRYTYVATGTTEVITSVAESSGNTQHIYGISNELTFNNTWQNGATWLTANWSNTGTGNTTLVPNTAGANAIFPAQGAPTSIDASNVTTGHIQVSGTNAWTITGSGLTLQTDNGGVAVLSTLSGSHSITAPITLNVTDAAKFGVGTLTLSNSVSGGQGLIVTNGMLILGASNSYTGATTINGGTLKLANSAALAGTSGVVIGTNGILDLNGNTTSTAVPANISGTNATSGALTNSGATVTYSGNITSTGNAFTVGGTGDIILTGAVSGATTVTVTKIGNNTLTLSGLTDNTNLILIINGGNVVLNKSSTGSVHALAGVTVASGSTLKLSGTGGDQIADTAAVVLNGGATLDLNSTSETIDSLNGGGSITNNAASSSSMITVGAAGGNGVFFGTIQDGAGSGVVALTKAGAGTLFFGATSSYTGATTISGGILKLATSGTLPTIANFSFETPALGAGFAYNPAGASWTFNARSGISGNGSAFGSTGAPDGTQAGLIQSSGTNGAISQALTFPNAGIYTLTFSSEFRGGQGGANTLNVTMDGVTIPGLGAVIPTSSTAFNPTSATFSLATGGTHTLAFTGAPPDSADRTSFIDKILITAGTAPGGNSAALPPTTVLKIGTGATLDLNSYNVTVASLADIVAGSGGAIINSNLATPATLSVNLASGSALFSGVISDNGVANAVSLVKGGAGILTLTGANTITGVTTINNGAVLVGITPSSTAAIGPVQINGNGVASPASAGSQLRGTGTAGAVASVDANNNAVVWPGVATAPSALSGTESLTVSSANFGNGGKLAVVLNATSAGANVTQQLIVNGNVSVDSTSTLSFTVDTTATVKSFVVLSTGNNNFVSTAFGHVLAKAGTATLSSGSGNDYNLIYRDTNFGASDIFNPTPGSVLPNNVNQIVVQFLNSGVTPVTIDAFTARSQAAGVLLSWNCVSEFQNAGFNIYRRSIDAGEWSKVNPSLIAGRITNPDGKTYRLYDWANPGVYTYKLESVSINGAIEVYKDLPGPVTVDGCNLSLDAMTTDSIDAAGSSCEMADNVMAAQFAGAKFDALVAGASQEPQLQSQEGSPIRSTRIGSTGNGLARNADGSLVLPATLHAIAQDNRALIGNTVAIDAAEANARSVATSQLSNPLVAARWFSSGTVGASSSFTGAKVVYTKPGLMLVPLSSLPAGINARHLAIQREGIAIPVLAVTADGLLAFGQGYEDDYTANDALFVRPVSGQTAAGQATFAQGLFTSRQPANVTSPASVTAAYHDVYYDFSTAFRPYTFAPWFSGNYLTASDTAGTTQTFAVNTPYASGSAATLTINLWSLTQSASDTEDHALQVLVNGQPAGQIAWNGGNKMVQLTFQIPSNTLVAGDNQVELVTPPITGVSSQIALLHSMTIAYTRTLDGSQPVSIYNSSTTSQLYELSNVPAGNVWVVDARFPSRATLVPYESQQQPNGTYKVRFSAASGGTGQYQVVPAGMENAPLSVTRVQVKPLKPLTPTGVYLATGPSQFNAGVQPLLMQRSKEGLHGQYADQEQLFNYYNYGRYGPIGIQNAVRAVRPQYLLLLGRTVYDYKNYAGLNIDPLCPAFLVSTTFWAQTTSDSQFGDLGRGYPEVAIGRLPVTTPAELNTAVQHILNYAGAPASGARVHAMADQADPSVADFPAQAAALGQLFPDVSWEANYDGVTYPTANQVSAALQTAANGGADWIVYIGHGNALRLGNTDNLLDTASVQSWKGDVVFIQSTCTANWMAKDVYDYKSIAIQALTQPQGGISMSIATSTYMNSDYAVPFMSQLMKNADGGSGTRWGNALMKTQQWAFQQGAQSSFYLDLGRTEQIFGDPAMPVFTKTPGAPSGPSKTSIPPAPSPSASAPATGTF